jgi:ADP-ribose pyrophosphatase YjhB (NUDIX family)
VAGADELLRWAADLTGIARAGLAHTTSLYEQERFEEVGRIAADIRAAARLGPGEGAPAGEMAGGGPGGLPRDGPKVAVGALVANDEGEILLVQRADSGGWLFPAGLADIGYSPAEVAVKETAEETGIDVEPVSLAAVIDVTSLGYRQPLYVLVFACRLLGGRLRPHPLETRSVGFFPRERLPEPLIARHRWVDLAFATLSGDPRPCAFD